MQYLLPLLTITITTTAILLWTIPLILTQELPSCDSLIYCQGKLLDTVQLAQIFNDSKSFVDLKLQYPENEILDNFNKLLNDTNNQPTKQQIQQFVNENFENANEFDTWTPEDYKENPKFLDQINDEDVKQFAKHLINLWPQLARKIKPDVINNSELYSFIPVNNGFIIPGGRFREFYYWDSYWIIKGLLISEMYDTVRGMLENFVSLIQRYGFIPNGSRIYYLNRSQPPLLTLMISDYIKETRNFTWLRANIKYIDQELKFWLTNHTVDIKYNDNVYTLAHYVSESDTPRPESYLEDIRNGEIFNTTDDKRKLYSNLKSGAESGWDFSTRWIFDQNGLNIGNISYINAKRVIPVDLNAFLSKAFREISILYLMLGDLNNAIFWLEKSTIWKKTIQQLLYNENDGIWYDWDLDLGQQRKFYYASNFAPLWTETYNILERDNIGDLAAKYYESQGLNDYLGGIPTSLENSGEQWDFPNAWAPLQAIIILGLENTGNTNAKNIAKDAAQRWIRANMIGYNNTNEMFEKYDAVHPGQYGGGGEYTVQSGFGWTNGVALQLIQSYYTST